MTETVNVKVLGVLAEIAESEMIQVDLPDLGSVTELMERIVAQYPAMKLVQCQLAVNQEIQKEGQINRTDDLILMPPFSGG